jgi:hypothetical protein
VERQHQAIDPQNRYGGLPFEKHDIYKDRSPLYSVDNRRFRCSSTSRGTTRT